MWSRIDGNFFCFKTKIDEILVDNSCFLVIFLSVLLLLKTESLPNQTGLDSVRFGSVSLKKWNQLDDILYQLIGSI